MRLTEGGLPNAGILQVYDGISKWGDVCMDQFHTYYIDVACRHLGYPFASSYFESKPTENSSFFVRGVHCDSESVDSYESCLLIRLYSDDQVFCKHVTGIDCFEGEFMLESEMRFPCY